MEDKSGNEIARLATGSKTTAASYESSCQLLGEEDDHKAGIYDDDEHVVTIIGESEGTMNLITYITEDGRVTDICYYDDLPVTEGGTYLMEETYLVNEYQEVIWPDRVENTKIRLRILKVIGARIIFWKHIMMALFLVLQVLLMFQMELLHEVCL